MAVCFRADSDYGSLGWSEHVAWFGDYRGKVVLVTGASSGIGRATALAFGAVGAKVALVARRRAALEDVAAEITRKRGVACVLPADVTRRAEVGPCLKAARARFGRVDVVVNNAGVLIPSAVEALRASDLNAMLRVNLFGALYVMQHAVRIMREQQDGGCIVNVASLTGRRGVSPIGGYCASKFALVGLTEALRTELHETKIHVALVMPGVVDTPMVQSVSEADPLAVWPTALTMPASWVVWAIFAAAYYRLVEISVPPGTATLEKLAALAPGVADSLIHWATSATHFLNDLVKPREG